LKKINNYNVLFVKTNNKTISVQSLLFHGFINESKENAGINHLLEHILANAYEKCKFINCHSYWNKIGGIHNATTSDNMLNYYITGLPDKIDEMLDYIIKITTTPIFNTKSINIEKQAVINEGLINLDNPKNKLYDVINKHFYTYEGLKYRHDYKQHIDNLKKFDKKYLMDYYKKNYHNNNILFIVSGNFDEKHVSNIFEKNLPIRPEQKLNIDYKKINCFTNEQQTFYIKNPALSI